MHTQGNPKESNKKVSMKTKALHKMKEAPLVKLKRLIGESEKGRSDWRSMVGK